MRKFVLIACAISVFAAEPVLTPDMRIVMDHVSADSLRGNLSFLASDLLEGRATPSRGLDLAAEYIAAQFRRAGLEPAGDDGYFQTATLAVHEQNPQSYKFTVTADGGKTLNIAAEETSILSDKTIHLENVPITTEHSDAAGKVFVMIPRGGGRPNIPDNAALVLIAGREPGPQVVDPEAQRGPARNVIASPELIEFLKHSKDARATIHVEPSLSHPAKVRNVAGILRGSDPALANTFVMLTAHYDHLGTRATGDDKIYNGANDDGSGTVSVMEIAGALAALHPHPKRSVIFVTFFGEERGLVGSRYYGRHPLVPLAQTVADLNLEQVGRTDASNGRQVDNASVTGFDFSDLPHILQDAGKLTGVKVYKDSEASDPFFARSDNQALADVGIPAHTLCVAFEYPDYHGVGDSWDKVDYANMAKVDRMVALGLLHIATDAQPPKWNESNPGAKKYADAARKLHP